MILTQWFVSSFDGTGFEIFCFGMMILGMAALAAILWEKK